MKFFPLQAARSIAGILRTGLMSQRYFFDTFNGTIVHDDVGCVLPDITSARQEARRLLQELFARSGLSDRERCAVRADVRDESGQRVFSATMTLMFEAD